MDRASCHILNVRLEVHILVYCFSCFLLLMAGLGGFPLFFPTASKAPNSKPQHWIGSLDFSESGNLAGNSQDCVGVADNILSDTSSPV